MNRMEAVSYFISRLEDSYSYTYKPPFHYQWSLVLMALPLAVMGFLLFRQGSKLLRMKRECTIEVTAVITELRRSRSIDGFFGGRRIQYNAEYQYEYDGTTYESHNPFYGRQHYQKPEVGQIVTIHINPFAPTELFDPLAEASMRFFFYGGAVMGFCVWMMTFGQIIMQLV